MELFAAIDLRAGRCVRLVQGDYARETVYGSDPVAMASELAADGAPWLHVVDLDAARTGYPENRAVVAAIAAAVAVPVQAGGGIRDEFSAEALLEAGVARIVVGTAALEAPDMVRRVAARHPGRVAAALDVRHGRVRVRGWTEGSTTGLLEAVDRLADAGVAALVVTDIGRDGTMRGPGLAGVRAVLGATALEVVASGGVGGLDDLRALAAVEVGGRRLVGVVVGKALYEGAFTVAQARAACAGVGERRS